MTPAHKLIDDSKYKNRAKPVVKEKESTDGVKPQEEVHSQLATICSSLLKNEQTLLQMLQNQMTTKGSDNAADSESVPTALFSQNPNNPNVMAEIQDFFNASNHNDSYTQTLSALRTAYERIEQHQLDMEFLRQQFERLNQTSNQHPQQPSSSNINGLEFRSPWRDQPSSLHFSSFGVANDGKVSNVFDTPNTTTQPQFQKETQTETTLFEDPFRPVIQQYRLFGEPCNEEEKDNKDTKEFDFDQAMEPTSPGVVGDRGFTYKHKPQEDEMREEDDVMFPYRLRVSEYNPLSYQGKKNILINVRYSSYGMASLFLS